MEDRGREYRHTAGRLERRPDARAGRLSLEESLPPFAIPCYRLGKLDAGDWTVDALLSHLVDSYGPYVVFCEEEADQAVWVLSQMALAAIS